MSCTSPRSSYSSFIVKNCRVSPNDEHVRSSLQPPGNWSSDRHESNSRKHADCVNKFPVIIRREHDCLKCAWWRLSPHVPVSDLYALNEKHHFVIRCKPRYLLAAAGTNLPPAARQRQLEISVMQWDFAILRSLNAQKNSHCRNFKYILANLKDKYPNFFIFAFLISFAVIQFLDIRCVCYRKLNKLTDWWTDYCLFVIHQNRQEQ